MLPPQLLIIVYPFNFSSLLLSGSVRSLFLFFRVSEYAYPAGAWRLPLVLCLGVCVIPMVCSVLLRAVAR